MIFYTAIPHIWKELAQFIVYTGPMSKMEKVESSVCSGRGSIAPGKTTPVVMTFFNINFLAIIYLAHVGVFLFCIRKLYNATDIERFWLHRCDAFFSSFFLVTFTIFFSGVGSHILRQGILGKINFIFIFIFTLNLNLYLNNLILLLWMVLGFNFFFFFLNYKHQVHGNCLRIKIVTSMTKKFV